MNDPPTTARSLRSWLGPFLLLVLGLACIPLALFGLLVTLAFDVSTVDADIPPDRAFVKLADLLRQSCKLKLDPETRVVVAHEIRTAMNRDGEEWYLVRLEPAHASRLEVDFLAAGRPSPMLLEDTPIETGRFRREGVRPVSWKAGPPSVVRAWRLDGMPGDCAVFFDDTFYLYRSHS